MAAERNIDVRIRLKGADQFGRGMKGVNNSLSTMGNWLDVTKGILGANFIQQGITKIIEKLGDAVDKSIDFESALAGVAKTTDFSDVGLRNFGNQLMELSQRIPITANDLAGLAETAGQLGIAEEDLLQFTETVAAMGVSTNMTAEEAAVAFARIANIFGTSSKEYSRLGSVIVDLGNNFATTESEIVDMAKNMSGMAALVGMTEADVLAFATALSSIGIEAAAGGSSMQKLFQEIEMAGAGGGFGLFADVAGRTNEEFRELWENNPAKAVEQFLSGLKNLENEGGSALLVLEEMEIKEVRLIRSILGLANAEGLLDKALSMANAAWKDNSALAEEAGKRYETTASRMQIAQNKIDNANVTIGDRLSDTVLAGKNLIGDLAAEWNEKAREINLESEVKKATEEYEAQKAIIDDNAQTAKTIADAIVAMGAPEALDADGQREYIANMQALTQLVPQINKIWDEETRTIEGGTAALYQNIDAAQRFETAQANLVQAQEKVDSYSIIEQSLQTQYAQLALAEAEYKNAQDEYERFWQDAIESGKTDLEIELGSTEYLERLSTASQALNELQGAIAENEAALEEYAYVVDEYENAAQTYSEAANGMTNASTGISASQQTAIVTLEGLESELDSIIEKYEEAQKTILATLDGITAGFAKIEPPEIETPESKLDALESQLEFIQAYSDALKKAQEMGIDQSIIQELSTGSVEDYTTLATLVSGTEEDVETINAKYAEVSAAKTALSLELAAAQTGLAGNVEAIVSMTNGLVENVDVGNEMYATGAANIQSLINGMNSKILSLNIKVSQIKNLNRQIATSGSANADGSHASGLAFVPSDGYIAQLHRGEMVLTALEAKAYRAEQFANYAVPAMMNSRSMGGGKTYNQTYNNTNNFGTVVVRDERDIREIAEGIAKNNKRRAKGRGYM